MIEGLNISCLDHIPVVGFPEEKDMCHCYSLMERQKRQLFIVGHESRDIGRWSGWEMQYFSKPCHKSYCMAQILLYVWESALYTNKGKKLLLAVQVWETILYVTPIKSACKLAGLHLNYKTPALQEAKGKLNTHEGDSPY